MHKIAQWIIILFLVINVFYVLVGVVRHPLESIDSYGIWMLKAKAWHVYEGVPWEFLKNPTYLYSHPQYPLLFPGLIAGLYSLLGGIHDYLVLLFSPLAYILALVLCYMTLGSLGHKRTSALFFTYVYSMFSPFLGQGGRMHAGNVDIVVTLLFWLAVLIRLRLSFHLAGPMIACIAAICSQVKLEGIFLLAFLMRFPIKLHKKICLYGLASLPLVIWTLLLAKHGITADFTLRFYDISTLMIRFFWLLFGVVKELVNWRNWYALWLVFGLLVFLFRFPKKSEEEQLLWTFCIVMVGFIGVYLWSTLDVLAYISSSFDRVLLQLSPFWFPVWCYYIKKLLR